MMFSRRQDAAECVVVLEPDLRLAEALPVMFVAQAALADAIGAIGPPNLGITFRWPTMVLANGGECGWLSVGYPEGCEVDDQPDWLLLHLFVRLHARGDIEPGSEVHRTVLAEEGAGDLTRTDLLEAYGRHLLSWIDRWTHDGFRGAAESWLFRAHDRGEPVRQEHRSVVREGTLLGLDDEANLLLKREGEVFAVSLAEVLGIEEIA